jgi:hypothetical protein
MLAAPPLPTDPTSTLACLAATAGTADRECVQVAALLKVVARPSSPRLRTGVHCLESCLSHDRFAGAENIVSSRADCRVFALANEPHERQK